MINQSRLDAPRTLSILPLVFSNWLLQEYKPFHLEYTGPLIKVRHSKLGIWRH